MLSIPLKPGANAPGEPGLPPELNHRAALITVSLLMASGAIFATPTLPVVKQVAITSDTIRCTSVSLHLPPGYITEAESLRAQLIENRVRITTSGLPLRIEITPAVNTASKSPEEYRLSVRRNAVTINAETTA